MKFQIIYKKLQNQCFHINIQFNVSDGFVLLKSSIYLQHEMMLPAGMWVLALGIPLLLSTTSYFLIYCDALI